ncbi:probable protein phosphatase 2C 40 isoform X2 [Beta vulgaris subsp. vulgaris]|uniref:probable protein phosphatase 2C 40 isoform X2 n=1 Tax=Beta vulgaris subsp. vulgaris TaxID=3555 RepID=UPI00203765F6|nr:probable protein phosphatase 2C 40 isoform X2 [Beta vulgaris subsp. vulgaris]
MVFQGYGRIMFEEPASSADGEIKVSFGYQCSGRKAVRDNADEYEIIPKPRLRRTSGSFSCLSGAALSANTTLANTNICNGIIGAEILPSWDSPNSFRRIPSSPSLSSKVDILSSSLQSTLSNLSVSPSSLGESPETDSYLKFMSASSPNEGFLNAMEVQVAGGAAGEDRVQAVCSEEDGWLFCAVYDGFNGRDAADFLAGTLYDTFLMNFNSFNWDNKEDSAEVSNHLASGDSLQNMLEDRNISDVGKSFPRIGGKMDVKVDAFSHKDNSTEVDTSSKSFKEGVLECLQRALSQAEIDFLSMVEQDMEDRPDLVSVGSCVLVALLVGKDLYTLNLGDSRVVIATQSSDFDVGETERYKAIQLTDIHNTDNEVERSKLLLNHRDDPSTITAGKVKGKLKVTRAFGVGYLKKKVLNDALMGILRVRNLLSPPYISTSPSVNVHRISKSDRFVVLGSDGLFDFFTNEEIVRLVHLFISRYPSGDPAKFLLEQLVIRAADCAGFSIEELMNIPPGRRRKYHDDVTVIVITLGINQRTSKASTCL